MTVNDELKKEQQKARRKTRSMNANFDELKRTLEGSRITVKGYADSAQLVIDQLEFAHLFNREKGPGLFNEEEMKLYTKTWHNLVKYRNGEYKGRYAYREAHDEIKVPLWTALVEAKHRLEDEGKNIDDFVK